MVDADIHRADSEDVKAVHELLSAARLPTQGISAKTDLLLVAKRGADVLGASAMEKHGDQGLLRSVVVAPDLRSSGIGRRLVEEALRYGVAEGLREIWLLTLDAEGYFRRFGFEVVARDAAEGPIRESAEFSVLCPDSATCMRRRLGDDTDS